MKIFQSPQKVLILFLSALIVISIFMIVRLESKAASLLAQWDEHKKSLEKNNDTLAKLEIFARYVKSNALKIDDSNIMLIAGKTWFNLRNDEVMLETKGSIKMGNGTKEYLGHDANKNLTYINYDGAQVTAGNITVAGKKYNGVLVRSTHGNTQLVMTDKGLMIGTTGKTGEYRLEFKPEKDIIKISKGKSEFIFEKDNLQLKVENDIEMGPSNEKNFGYRKSEDYIYMLNKDSRVVVGPLLDQAGKFKSNGIMLISKTDGPHISIEDKRISISAPGKDLGLQVNLDKEKVIMAQGQSKVSLEKNKLEIEVVGDINITSKNGNVNINGKKVNLNE